MRSSLYTVAMFLSAITAHAQTPADAVPVTADNFPRAESDVYFGGLIKDAGGIGKFVHRREPTRLDNQTVIRLNQRKWIRLGI